ncbi:hypothetical protein Tco_0991103 [Tanacetum coccineum]|uniref:Uncharacterized protein n=1 Tax=Tanacetum coccineum TaxID=301880 RepID=A0ABQ5EYY8_9ASTR
MCTSDNLALHINLPHAACIEDVNQLKKRDAHWEKLWNFLNEDEACLTHKFNNFPKGQVKIYQSLVDVPIHQEDLAVQRTPLIDLLYQWFY